MYHLQHSAFGSVSHHVYHLQHSAFENVSNHVYQLQRRALGSVSDHVYHLQHSALGSFRPRLSPSAQRFGVFQTRAQHHHFEPDDFVTERVFSVSVSVSVSVFSLLSIPCSLDRPVIQGSAWAEARSPLRAVSVLLSQWRTPDDTKLRFTSLRSES